MQAAHLVASDVFTMSSLSIGVRSSAGVARGFSSEGWARGRRLSSTPPRLRSRRVCRQVKTVLPPVGLRVPVFRPVLCPSAPVFCPSADRLPPTGTTTKPPTAFRVPVVECDDTLLKTHVGPSHIFSMKSTDLTVP